MKGMVVFDTSYRNTKTIAEAISETLNEFGIEVDSFHVKDVKKLTANGHDFLIIGSPTRFGKMSFAIKRLLGKVKTQDWMNKSFAAFDTELPGNIEKQEGSAAEKIAEKLRERRMNQLLPVLKAVVSEVKGYSLMQGELERAKDYARRLAIELNKCNNS